MYSYLCILPDFEQGSKRLDVRPQHLANAVKEFESGSLIQGGALLSKDEALQDGEAPKMTGSFMLINAESLEKAKEKMEKDVYATGGAWDMSKAQYYPVKVAKH